MSRKTLNQANLAALGADQLAALLIEVSTGSADIKRRLRLELSHNLGPAELARDVRKRLATLRKSKTYVGWRKRKALIKDLGTQVSMITDKIAPDDPTLAFDLLWEFMELAPSIFARTDDSKGDVDVVFDQAMAGFDALTGTALLDVDALAERVWLALQDNPYGTWDGIITTMLPALGDLGTQRLKDLLEAYAQAPAPAQAGTHEAIQFLRQLRDEQPHGSTAKLRFVRTCLQEIAAATGDTAAYIAQFSPSDLHDQATAAEVAMLLLDDGQPQRALDILQDADQDGYYTAQQAWDAATIACLSALDRVDEAQDHRWACFKETLHHGYLRDYLRLLPDFDDVEAEDRAKAFAASFPDFSKALAFFLDWPDTLAAAGLVMARGDEIDGDKYVLMTRAAEALRGRHPLAATLLKRAMINYALGYGRVARYADAADHLSDCTALDMEIEDYGAHATHAQYLESLRTRHERKASFWDKVV